MAVHYERPAGITDYEWREFLREAEENAKALLARVCPDCGSKVTKKLDRRPEVPQEMWFSYQCTNRGCDFLQAQREAN